nr:hypothetical protein [Tanacetum cinerariifolium]
MKDNQVWILVELPPNGRNVGSKWIFKKKTDIIAMLQEFNSWLCKCFSMKDLGEAGYILRIKLIHDRSKWLIALSQSAYLEKILKKFRMENSKKGYTPMMEKPDYRKSQGVKAPTEQNPGEIHWTGVKTILKYLRNTKDMVFMYE